MIDHLLIYVAPDLLDKTVAFYLAALAPLGYEQRLSYMNGAVVGFGDGEKFPDFWVASTSVRQEHCGEPGYVHFAFNAKGREPASLASHGGS